MTPIHDGTTGRGKVLGARIPDIVFRRPQAAPIGSSFNSLRINGNQLLIEAADARLGQQLLENHF